jgi:hypothetical protein
VSHGANSYTDQQLLAKLDELEWHSETSAYTLPHWLYEEVIKRLRGPWRPIETAPKKGDNLLLSDGESVSEGGWLSDLDMGADYEGQFGGGAGWWSVHGSMVPTHWMPMPSPATTSPIEKEKP